MGLVLHIFGIVVGPRQRFVRGMIRLEYGPIIAGQQPPNCLSGPCQSQNWGRSVQRRILKIIFAKRDINAWSSDYSPRIQITIMVWIPGSRKRGGPKRGTIRAPFWIFKQQYGAFTQIWRPVTTFFFLLFPSTKSRVNAPKANSGKFGFQPLNLHPHPQIWPFFFYL